MAGTPPATRLRYAIGWLFYFRALQDRIGVRKVRYATSGAAPIAPEVLRFFMGIGVPMHEVYGMTENTAIATANRPGRVKLGTVGEPHPGIELRIDETTGEILTRHPGTFAGYWKNPEATAQTIDADGWLHTGDVGEWVDGTYVKITDRMKDIIITAGGKNVAPSEIENALKASPYIKEAIVIGDRRPYLTALIGIELDTVGHWAQTRKLPYTTYRDLGEKKEVRALVQSIVDDVNARFATVEQVKKFSMLTKELDHEDGELTATQKVKRNGDRDDVRRPGRGHVPMTELVQCLVRGLGDGSVYALLAFGFVIIYKSMGVISFAQPAFMLAGAVLVTYLVTTRELLPRGGAGRRRGGAAGGGRRADRAAADDRQAGVRHLDHHAGRRHRDQGGGQRLHRAGRAAGRRPVGTDHVAPARRSRCSSGTWSCSSPRWCWSPCCSRSSATPGWAWRCARSRSTRKWRWPKGFRWARCSRCPGRSPARSPRSPGCSCPPAPASTSSCGSSR